jgi:hypothetical protein
MRVSERSRRRQFASDSIGDPCEHLASVAQRHATRIGEVGAILRQIRAYSNHITLLESATGPIHAG